MKKVNFLCLIMLGLFFVACHSNDDTWETGPGVIRLVENPEQAL